MREPWAHFAVVVIIEGKRRAQALGVDVEEQICWRDDEATSLGAATLRACLGCDLQVRVVLESALEAEGSSSEDTTDEAFERLHAPLLEEERVRLNPVGEYLST